MGKIKLILGASLLLISYYSSASVIMFYDRAEWELSAAEMGLKVSTNDFRSSPRLFPDPPIEYFDPTGRFTLGGTSWDINGSTYNSSEENLIQTGEFDLGLSIHRLPRGRNLFGLGFETLDSVGRITVLDINDDWQDSRFCCEPDKPITGFVGILSTFAIQPADNFREVTIDGIPMSRIDDFSIAVSPVPAPAAIWLFGTGLIGLIGFTKRRKAA